MGLLDMCCPKKPKMTLDYVIKWVEETDKTLKEVVDWMQEIKEMDLQKVFDDYARDGYDWSQVPEFDAKADKVKNATAGNFDSLDASGNLVDSGYKASNFADANHSHNGINLGGIAANHILIEENNSIGRFHVQLFDSQEEEPVFSDSITAEMLNNTFDPATTPAQGNQKLITSGAVYTALQGKAPTTHSHNQIQGQRTATYVECEEEEGTGSILISVEDAQEGDDSDKITYNNMPNLKRALRNPSTTPEDDDTKLITSKAVFNALKGKIDNSITTIYILRTQSGYPIQGQQTVVESLNSFITSYQKGKWALCAIRIYGESISGSPYVLGFASWWYNDIHNEYSVRVFIGTHEFVATAQATLEGGIGTWAPSWTMNDYSQDFF